MGRFKWRQGRSVDIGLPRNRPRRTVRTFFGRMKPSDDTKPKEQMGWLSVVALSLLRPFRVANAKFQTYRRKV